MILDRRMFMTGLAGAALLPSRLRAQPSQGLDEVLARHTRARGGAAALDRVRSCLIEVEITERGQTISGRYAAIGGERPSEDRVRIDIFTGGRRVYAEGIDDHGVWLRSGDSPPEASVATGAANALLHGVEFNLFGLHRFPARGHRLRRVPDEPIDGVLHPAIEAVYSTGHVTYFFFDPASAMLVRRRDRRAYHPDASTTQQQVETVFFDFQTVDGVVTPHRNLDRDLTTGAVLANGRVISRALNPSFPGGYFGRSYVPG